MEVILYKFSKRYNSTKQPTQEDVIATLNLNLKGSCSITSPSFFLSGYYEVSYIKAWNNYYFVTDINYDINGAQYIDCEIDVLATWKEQILNHSAFIEYSSSNYDNDVVDDRIAQRVLETVSHDTKPSVFTSTIGIGCYVLTASGVDIGVYSVALDENNFKLLVRDLLTATGTDLDNLNLQFAGAISSIASVRWVPFINTQLGDEGYEVWLGSFHTNAFGYLVNDKGTKTDSQSLSVHRIYGDFRRCSKYSSYVLTLPFIGSIDIDANSLKIDNTFASALNISMVCNVITGKVLYTVSNTYNIIGTYDGDFGIAIPVSSQQKDSKDVVRGLLTSLAGAGTIAGVTLATGGALTPIVASKSMGGAVLGGAAAFLKGATQATIAEKTTHNTMIGGFGGNNSQYLIGRYELVSKEIKCRTEPSELRELYGRPCYRVLQISTLSGYVQTIGFSADIISTSEIKQRINTMMDSGVYLE